jgi:hypothetical protein
MNEILICCDVVCDVRMECGNFLRALDVNGGKIRNGYAEVKCENRKQYEIAR